MEVFIKLKEIKKINNQGIGLVESLIAIALAIILIVSLLTLTNFNIRNSLLVTENQDAINSANNLLENLRSLKDSNFTTFLNTVSANCLRSNNKICSVTSGVVTEASINLDNQSPYSYFNIVKVSDNEVQIFILTQWKVGNNVFSSPLQTTFSNWRSN
jgi:type II secretory pathway pseudopilin PulG